jgi:drug/metabolite transporter (DMT)-like permease
MYSIIILISYVFFSAIGLFLIKSSVSIYSTKMYLGLVMYAVGSLIWLILLRFLPLTLAFPLATGAMILGTGSIGVFFLHENFEILQILGAFFIMVGVWLVMD